jgi:lipocalin
MVGSKDRKSLWFLSRRPEMPQEVIERYTQIASEEGFPIKELKKSEF